MKIDNINQIFSFKKPSTKKRIAVVWANDLHTIKAVEMAVDLNIVDATLIGTISLITEVCQQEGIDINKFELIDAETDIEAASIAIKMINNNEANILMKGLITTDKYMRAILNKEAGLLPPKGILSHVAVIESEFYHKLLVVGDVAIIPEPNLQQKIAIANYLIRTARAIGIERPKLAIISVSEQILPSIKSSIEAAVLSKMGERGQINHAIIDGPFSLDAAIDKRAVITKNIGGEVAGDADCLLFPNLESGNVYYKMNTKMSNAKIAAFVAGAKVPCVLSSRSDSTETKLNSIALCVALS